MEIDGRVGAATGQGLFHVKARRSGDWWALSVDGHPGIHSQAKTLASAEANIREAIELGLDLEPDSFAVHVMPDLDHDLLLDLIRCKQLTHEAAELQQAAAALTRQVAGRLSDLDLSQRDVAQVMGVSFQRVNQLLGDAVPEVQIADIVTSLNETIATITATRWRTTVGDLGVASIREFVEATAVPSDWLTHFRATHEPVAPAEPEKPVRKARSTSGARRT